MTVSRRTLANAIRFLSVDAVQKANSGHPGMPLGMADIAEVLWNDYLKHNPADPKWWNRDRFVLSNGHGSMLVYSLLHLSGYDLSMNEIENFRQLGFKTPGHPEYGVTPGVETTTGPLGQGLANAVGMALAEKILAENFNREGFPIVDHHTYAFVGDGCLMEGVSHEACSLAGSLGLGKLIVIYDDNGISIDGQVKAWFGDDTPKRFEAYGWQVIPAVDGHNPVEIAKALEAAREETGRPSIICCRTVIGFGAPNLQGSAKTHGAALGNAEIADMRKNLDWEYPPFAIPQEIYQAWDARERGRAAQDTWNKLFEEYAGIWPDLAAELTRRLEGRLPDDWSECAGAVVRDTAQKAESKATRQSSQKAIAAYAAILPEMIGGSADLTCSNLTTWPEAKAVNQPGAPVPGGNYLYYGVREFGMGAIMNGLALHGGFIPFGGTFLIFSDYARNAIRMASLMEQRLVWVLTHDSIGLGEDGPTHQPVEQLSSLRLIPGLSVWRPCDTVETAQAWRLSLEECGHPSALVLSRQKTPHVPRDEETIRAIAKGGYILKDSPAAPRALIIATGSEVGLALAAQEILAAKGIAIRVVSMPNMALFLSQEKAWRDSVLPPSVTARVAVEASSSALWAVLVGPNGRVVGLDHFGESAPAEILFAKFGFTADNVVKTVEQILSDY